MRLSEQVAESLTAAGSTCVSHQFLKSVLLATATSSSLAGSESPNAQRTCYRVKLVNVLIAIEKASNCPKGKLYAYQRHWVHKR